MRFARPVVLAAVLGCAAGLALAESLLVSEVDTPRKGVGESSVFAPPNDAGPVVVRASLVIHDINEIDEETETFEFSGVLTLKWRDPRQAFDPSAAGVQEKFYTGNFQFNEISPGWYPQIVLVNESGLFEKNGVLLRVQPDGTSTLIETVNAVAEVDLNLRRFPFDEQRLEAVFEVLGFDRDEVVLEFDPDRAGILDGDIHIPQWNVKGAVAATRHRTSAYAGRSGVASEFAVGVDVARRPFFILRLVVFPLFVIVLLSFAVFWMDRASMGDRISVSFIGILTGIAYLFLISDIIPRISYITLIHGYLNFSFLTMCATVVVNVKVGALVKNGKHETAEKIDRRCQRLFPLAYFCLILLPIAVAFTFY
jgi:hypothetical protein